MKVKRLLYGVGSMVGVACAVAFGSAIYLHGAYAESISGEVNITPSINVTIPTDTVTLNLAPTSSASFNSTNLSVTVATNNPTGYTLTMAPSDSTSTSLTRTGGTETIPTLATLAGGYTEQTFTTNRWGYKLSSGNYLPFATSNEINVTDSPSNASTNTVTFAAKADMSQTSGAYTLEIAFTAVANYVPPADVPSTCATPVPGNYTYLQDITSSNKASVLASLTEGSAYYLRDSRDEEPYCIAKLADGNLWLLDNLRLDLSDSTVLAALTPSNTNADAASLTSLRSGNRTAGTNYATDGLKYITSSGGSWTSSYDIPYIVTGNSGTDYKTQTVTSYGVGSGRVGIYYNYCAASAGSYCYDGGTGNASYDLCPAGWHMPTGGSSGEYQALHGAYSGNATATSTASLQYNLSTPLSGYFYYGSANAQEYSGSFWSSTHYSGSYAYCLRVGSSYVYPQANGDRYYAYPVRCVLGS